MKKALILPLAALIGMTVLTGCTRTSYAIQTNDGRTIISDGKPSESDAGLLAYTDASNRLIKPTLKRFPKYRINNALCGIKPPSGGFILSVSRPPLFINPLFFLCC